MENNFPPSMTVDFFRKKWANIMQEYHRCMFLKKTKWQYYDLFEKYLGDYTSLEHFSNWTTKWISELIELRINHSKLFLDSYSEDDDGWNLIEYELRKKGLPVECSVQKIDKLWFALIKIFDIIHKYVCKDGSNANVWPYYEQIKVYYDMNQNSSAVDTVKDKIDSKCIVEHDNSDDVKFKWNPEWTQSFIHIRLQHKEMFKHKKQSWKDFHGVMMDNGFPRSITVDCIRRKWNMLYDQYEKSLMINNTKWKYYDLFHSYLGKSASDPLKNWSTDWVKALINAKMEVDESSTIQDNDKFWANLELKLRIKGIPVDYTLRNIESSWTTLIKIFKVRHKFMQANKTPTNWEFYDDIHRYLMRNDPEFYPSKPMSCDVDNSVSSDCKIEEFIQDNEYSNVCRACLGKSEPMVPIFDPQKNWAYMIICCAPLQLTESDNLPKQLCNWCVKELEVAYNFRRKCEESDKFLRNVNQAPDHVIKCEPDVKSVVEMIHSPNPSSDTDEPMEPIEQLPTKPKMTNKPKSKRKYVYWKICDVCGVSTQKMNEHMKRHSEVKSYQCPKCPKTFTYNSNLQTHLKTHNTTPLKVCQFCGRKFFRNLTYKRHLVHHANERKFSCETCGKTFNTNDILKVHIRSHTGERPYSCKICGKSFLSSGCVARHQKVHKKQNVNCVNE